MEQPLENRQGTLTQLRAYLAQSGLAADAKLPPERELAEILGATRSDLRRALALLEREGELWRHVGKGTFLGARPEEEMNSVAAISARSNPAEVMRTRVLIEPLIAREAALHATAEDTAELRRCLRAAGAARSWRAYESWDNRLHRTLAQAAHNLPLLAMFDTLNTVRRAINWGNLRPTTGRPAANHHSFLEHRRIVAAVENRNQTTAEAVMREHLGNVARDILAVKPLAELSDEQRKQG